MGFNSNNNVLIGEEKGESCDVIHPGVGDRHNNVYLCNKDAIFTHLYPTSLVQSCRE